ncbi:hypothetical protein CERSUDRAFT_98164 [Gelatoporia subvermispora B]|uniref:BTB domain-containing protein n=1 Tax=Ceriporiopsis subvermispora (strain B) TaxID=914234 RepID=M2R3V6_CERS8|nr:hypothetical protein CERSUDRAFT_98164 [Gelatoporia subvermispora B]
MDTAVESTQKVRNGCKNLRKNAKKKGMKSKISETSEAQDEETPATLPPLTLVPECQSNSPMATPDEILNRLPSIANKLQVIQAAHNHLITAGIFVDTKIYCFSRRWSSGKVDRPRPLYANSIALRHASQYFQALLSGAFREGGMTNLNADYPPASPDTVYDYDYESDSDLDYEEEKDSDVEMDSAINEPCTDEQASMGEDLNDAGAHTANEGAASSDGEHVSPSSLTEDAIRDDSSTLKGPPSAPEAFGRGRTVYIQDMAFNTWQALIFYIYFGEVRFAPLKSQNARVVETLDAWSAPLCSPKSMYRLADKYGLDDLKKRALDDIRLKLSTKNIWTELLSRFTSRYAEVQGIQIDFVMQNHSYSMPDIQNWVDIVTVGSTPHSNTILATLIMRLLARGQAAPSSSYWR